MKRWLSFVIFAFILFNVFQTDNKPRNAPVSDKVAMQFTDLDWPPSGAPEDSSLDEQLATKNYYVVLDGSGSMRDRDCGGGRSKAEAAQVALAKFANSLREDVKLGLLVFDARGVREQVPLGTDNRPEFAQALSSLRPDGSTPLKLAMSQARRSLEQAAQTQLGYGEYHLVVVTDGKASRGQSPAREVASILRTTPVVIHTIGFCIRDNHTLNQPGKVLYRSALNPAELESGLQSVLAESESFSAQDFGEGV